MTVLLPVVLKVFRQNSSYWRDSLGSATKPGLFSFNNVGVVVKSSNRCQITWITSDILIPEGILGGPDACVSRPASLLG